MNEVKLANLKLQVEHLLSSYNNICAENKLLRTKLSKVTQERAVLLDKIEVTRKQVRTVIEKIKEHL
ncbi:MAG: hypothetical protein JXR42_00015 [Gammaproteobacteria bacterium]|nr:hypothetical protein [Gammaproteobacteria bacterium]